MGPPEEVNPLHRRQGAMTKGFIKLQRASDLMNTDPNAFLILSTVARFMGRDGSPARITPRLFPTMTRKQYREAISRLTKAELGAFKGRTKFTEGSLLTRAIYDINETGASEGPSNAKTGATKQEGSSKKKEVKTGAKARPADVQQVHEYMVEKGQPDYQQAESFWDHYASNGWKIGGKSPMKDWKAAVRNWLKNNFGGKQDAKRSTRDIQAELLGNSRPSAGDDARVVSPLQAREPHRHEKSLGRASAGIFALDHRKGDGDHDG